jgi:hypothetical protein
LDWWEQFVGWLKDEPVGGKWPLFLVAALEANFLLSIVCVVAAHAVVPIGPVDGAQELIELFMRRPDLLLWGAALEEALFRLPLAIFLLAVGVGRVTIGAAALLSFAFGELHGPWHALVQGPAGFLLCIVFIKCGGARKGRGFIKGYGSAVAVHTGFNTVLFVLTLIGRLFGIAPGN